MKITSTECKEYIYNNPAFRPFAKKPGDWKRVKKHQQDGRTRRVFSSPDGVMVEVVSSGDDSELQWARGCDDIIEKTSAPAKVIAASKPSTFRGMIEQVESDGVDENVKHVRLDTEIGVIEFQGTEAEFPKDFDGDWYMVRRLDAPEEGSREGMLYQPEDITCTGDPIIFKLEEKLGRDGAGEQEYTPVPSAACAKRRFFGVLFGDDAAPGNENIDLENIDSPEEEDAVLERIYNFIDAGTLKLDVGLRAAGLSPTFKQGQDNGLNVIVVDSAQKAEVLKRAFPTLKVEEITQGTFDSWRCVFGEFDERGMERWYRGG